MRKKTPKIELHRETLRRLDAAVSGARAIGSGDHSGCEIVTECPSNCFVSCEPTCGAGCAGEVTIER